MKDYYVLKVRPGDRERMNPALDLYLDQGELYLSPTMHLCSHSAMARIETQELAEQFMVFSLTRIQERYGVESVVEMYRITASGTDNQLRKIAVQIGKDSEKVRQLLTGKPPAGRAGGKKSSSPALAATIH